MSERFSIPGLIKFVREKLGKKPSPVAEPVIPSVQVAKPVSLEVEIPTFVASPGQAGQYTDAILEAVRTGRPTGVDLTKPRESIKIIPKGE